MKPSSKSLRSSLGDRSSRVLGTHALAQVQGGVFGGGMSRENSTIAPPVEPSEPVTPPSA